MLHRFALPQAEGLEDQLGSSQQDKHLSFHVVRTKPFQRAQWYARAALLPENIRNGDTQDTADAHGR